MKLFKWFKPKTKQKEVVINISNLPKKARNSKGLPVIMDHAKKCGYSIVMVNYDVGMIRYRKKFESYKGSKDVSVSINFYSTNGTITTELVHPKKGKTQLHRKGLNLTEIKSIFDNPREHTGNGYYKKKK